MHSADELTSITCPFNLDQTDFACPVKSNSSCMKGKVLSMQVQAGVFKNGYKSSHEQQHWDLKAE